MNVSVVIPTYKRIHLLKRVLRSLSEQSYKPYEIIVVDDSPDEEAFDSDLDCGMILWTNGSGPAAARNHGAKHASGDILLFIGDDTIADRDLIIGHVAQQLKFSHPAPVQGMTLWHPEVVSEFQTFLTDVSGFQVNWQALKNEDGSWKESGDAFCITTNFSVPKSLFDFVGGFDERFRAAAWEDIDLGYKLALTGHATLFAPRAINYHHHRYTLAQYVERQKKEGLWRIRLLLNYPEMAGQHIHPQTLKIATQANLKEELHFAQQLDYANGKKAQALRYERWSNLLSIGSQVGIIDGLRHFWSDEYSFVNVQNNDCIPVFFMGMSGLDRGDKVYASLCATWAVEMEKSAATFKYAADVYERTEDSDLASTYLRKFEASR